MPIRKALQIAQGTRIVCFFRKYRQKDVLGHFFSHLFAPAHVHQKTKDRGLVAMEERDECSLIPMLREREEVMVVRGFLIYFPRPHRECFRQVLPATSAKVPESYG